ncbi:MAG: hypothetical protein HGA45_15400, partial [Chloroflexales bacterium]|nr:hypothetical protein [Chloroflexales bacterium]
MSRRQPAAPQEPLALHQWREQALTPMLHIILLAPLPVFILDLLRLLPQRAYLQIAVDLLAYVVVVALVLYRRIPYQWRSFALLGASLLFATYLLLSAGLIGAGRVYLVVDIVVAALLLSRRSTLLVWLCGAAALTLSGLAFAGRPPAEVADLAQRLTDPNTLLTNGMLTLVLSALVALGAASLVHSLAESLRATEQALAERDQTNAALEQGVAERTRELELALDAHKLAELALE